MNEAWIPKVAVLGAGAMGSMFGGLLGEGGLEVTLIDIWAEHVAAVQQSGLRLLGDSAERSVPVKATTRPAEAGEADVVLVHCKSHHTVQAVEAARSLFGADTVAISFQNGLGNEEMIGSVIGIERVLGGTTAQGASMVGPGAVRYYGDLPSQIGELAGGTSERAERIARARLDDDGVAPALRLVVDVVDNPRHPRRRERMHKYDRGVTCDHDVVEIPGSRRVHADVEPAGRDRLVHSVHSLSPLN